MSTSSRESSTDGAPKPMEAAFKEEDLVWRFEVTTVEGAWQTLRERNVAILAVAREYVEYLHDFQVTLREAGFADHPDIKETGIMQ